MTDESITIPDFLPVELQEEHGTAAREQVEESRSHGGRHAEAPAAGGRVRARLRRQPARSHKLGASVAGPARGTGPVSWLSASEIPLVTAAAVVGLLGMCGLTTWWSWLAVTQDAMWWGFTAVGGALLGALAWALVAVRAHRRHLAARAGEPHELSLDDLDLDDLGPDDAGVGL